MARRFFIEKVPSNNNSLLRIIIVLACIIGVIICFVIISNLARNSHKNAVYEINDVTYVPLNSKLEDKTIFFKELKNVKEKDIKIDTSKADLTKSGKYNIRVSLYNNSYDVIMEVVDSESPEVTVKDINIENGYKYTAADFVESCVDNSLEECQYKFYDLATDQDGNKIDYSSYTANGEYTIQIQAFDSAENETAPVTAKLTIGTPSESGDILCKYGNNDYDTEKYILATYITDNNCSVDLNLYNDKKISAAAEKIMANETTKLKKEFESLRVYKAITLNRDAQAVINKDQTGIVGYTVHMELLVDNKIVESYYVDLEGQRIYSVNEYNLK